MDTTTMVVLGFCQSVHGLKGAFKLNLENLEGRTIGKGSKVRLFSRNGKGHLPQVIQKYNDQEAPSLPLREMQEI